MGKRIIVIGDGTSHGGVVISGSPTCQLDGKAVARLGDQVDCPATYPDGSPHGVNPITEGEARHQVDGLPVAVEGCKTACGCTLLGSSMHTV